MDIAEKGRPQDGRISVRAPERMVDLRVSSLPTLHGENVVLRVLDRGGVVRRIEEAWTYCPGCGTPCRLERGTPTAVQTGP